MKCTCQSDWGAPEKTCSDYAVCTEFRDLRAEIDRLRAALEDLATGVQHREVMVRKAREALTAAKGSP